jgi:hypothetical protein
MAKKRGNPNWGKPDIQSAIIVPTSFEEIVKQLRLSPADYEGSVQLKEWARKNKDQKYIPDDLLRSWGFEVKADL